MPGTKVTGAGPVGIDISTLASRELADGSEGFVGSAGFAHPPAVMQAAIAKTMTEGARITSVLHSRV
ncbi:hypothetical protein B2J88_43225 [Rhodococcus sp. SRB_17]|nr:hypothetical protein [Rhodococcus sp. SRB_17]